jgi:fibro-slime domain-containing protein
MRVTFFGALAVFSLVSGLANASTITIDYYSVPNNGSNGDFNICCSSPPATLPVILPGSALGPNGLPVSTGGTVQSLNGSSEILWWTNFTGTSTAALPFLDTSMFTPNGTGSSNSTAFQTAVLYGTILGSGSNTILTVNGDDDVLVYLDGKYVGGTPGVHQNQTVNLDLGILSAVNHDLKVFYADRAQTDAVFGISVVGGEINASPVPGPIVGAGLPGLVMALGGLVILSRRRRNQGAVA